jgi:hypothetical protein
MIITGRAASKPPTALGVVLVWDSEDCPRFPSEALEAPAPVAAAGAFFVSASLPQVTSALMVP